jgi:hypothetical protein
MVDTSGFVGRQSPRYTERTMNIPSGTHQERGVLDQNAKGKGRSKAATVSWIFLMIAFVLMIFVVMNNGPPRGYRPAGSPPVGQPK